MRLKEHSVSCPQCRGRVIRRRKRDSLKLVLVSIFGKWPYRCDACGSEFFLNRRYLNRRKKPVRDDSTAA